MGGNATVKNRSGDETEAQEIPLKDIGRKEFVSRFQEVLKVINKKFEKDHKKKLWVKEELITNAFLFNGSTSFIMSPDYTDEEIVKYKPVAGDLDVMIPRPLAKDLYHTLTPLENKEIVKGCTYMGTNADSDTGIGNTLICVVLMEFDTKAGKIRVPAQIDFELSDFDEDDTPTDWARFSHGSSFSDTKAGIKAVHHKYLLRAIVGAANQRDDIVLLTDKSPHDPEDKKFKFMGKSPSLVRLLAFGVDAGVGKGYIQVMNQDGTDMMHNGKYVYQKAPKTEKKYEKNIENIFQIVFGQENNGDLDKIHSFVGVLELGKKYLDKKVRQGSLDRYTDILFGNKGNQIQIIVPDANKDVQLKGAAYDMIVKEWGLKEHSNYSEIVDAYVAKAHKIKVNEHISIKPFVIG